jgi:DNA-binding transcriptional LysR family regulator
MMAIRHLQYLTALARERHCASGRSMQCDAADAFGRHQATRGESRRTDRRARTAVSWAHRGGRTRLAWAQRVLVDYGGLQQELGEIREGPLGQLRIGAIPVTLPIVPLLTAPFTERHQRTDIVVISQTSISIQRGLDDFSLDIGVTYLDNEPLARVRCLPLYQERYVLLTRREDRNRVP